MTTNNLYNYPLDKLETLMLSIGEKKYRATQLFHWLYQKKATSFEEMSDISLSFREELKKNYSLSIPKIDTKQLSTDGTIKLLVEMEDGMKVETVLMRYDYGDVACVSSQVGCAMGCSFCASGLLGKKRNLEPYEMVGQILCLNNELAKEGKGERVTHIVLMGTGEPFDNYDNVMDFIRIVNNQHGLSIGARHITVSTCGIVEGIKKYANEGLQTNLAISLHAPNDEIRNKLMNINHIYPLSSIMEAVREYLAIAKRRVTYEYILIEDVNDSYECAQELVDLVGDTEGYVNLIPYNETHLVDYKRSSNNRIHAFQDYLNKHGVSATIRKEFGSDIDAACGQLKAKAEGKNV